VVRQPICDASLRVVGYELLFEDAASTEALLAGTAGSTSSLIVDAFSEIGLDELVGHRPAYLDVSRDFLLSVSPLPLRPDRVVLELDAVPEVDEAYVAILRRLGMMGFPLALDCFPGEAAVAPELLDVAGIVKVDVRWFEAEALSAEVARLAERRLTLIATGVDTQEELERCRAAGFERFQGRFLASPSEVRGRGVPTQSVGALSGIARMSREDLQLEELEELVVRDVGLSYKLLRYVNSAFFALPRRIESIHDAILILGTRMVSRWALVLSLAATHDKPDELAVTALVRARMCELLGRRIGQPDAAFTVGLFSVVEALLDAPMEDVLAQLPFAEDITNALLRREGPLGEILRDVVAYEAGDFGALALTPEETRAVSAAYREAIAFSDDAVARLA
jgi:EAL and modified HD-GYP domain-containing signal transduction protein